ncbi:MAG: DUF2156 domain-containing protein [Acidobacteria bacterium]|nr:DUF2156 domain-containing protein [Acidobacteriota bacterium]
MRIPDFPELRPLSPDDHPMLVERLGPLRPAICDLSPANLFIWRDCEIPSITQVGESLCILVESHSEPPYFLEPVGGDRRADVVRACLTRHNRLSRCGRTLAEALSPQEFDVRPLRDHFDYVYRTVSLAELKGKRFDGKRNQIRRFIGSFPDHDFRPLDQSRLAEAMALFERWTERRAGMTLSAGLPPQLALDCQRRALERALEGFERLGLVGGAMIVRGELQAFIIASTDQAETAVVHFQYANAEIPGIYQALLREACRRLFDGCAYVNLEEDLGVPGLRKTKLSYGPLRIEEKYEIRIRAAASPGESDA